MTGDLHEVSIRVTVTCATAKFPMRLVDDVEKGTAEYKCVNCGAKIEIDFSVRN